MHVVVVGASLAGMRTAQALRMQGFDGEITVVGAETAVPYDRPPLSKAHLAPGPAPTPEPLLDAVTLAGLRLDLRLGTAATGLDPAARVVLLGSGETLGYDRLVIATGARARPLDLDHGLAGFHELRTLEDAEAIRTELDGRPAVAVLGGGFIGAEVAAAARRRDLDVTMIEMLEAPMARALGVGVGGLLGRLHADHGVVLRCGTTVVGARGSTRVEQLDLAGGETVAADLVVVGLGATPATEWLAGSGLDVTDGVACDSGLHVLGHPDIYAAGDVARWHHPLLDGTVRFEHWTNAQDHASVVAAGILGQPRLADAVPYVWSDQYDRRIQIVGRPASTHEVTILEDPAEGRHVAVYERDDRVTGVFTVNNPKAMMRGRRAVAGRLPATGLLSELAELH